MCGPAAAIGAIGSVASTGLGIMGAMQKDKAEKQAIYEHNQKVLENAQRAGIAASSQYADMGTQFNYEARAAQIEAQKAHQQGVISQGTVAASAGSSGFNGSSMTVGAVMADIDRRIAENDENYALKVDDLKDSFRSKGRMVQAQAQDRINSMSMQSYPDGGALGLNIANAVVGGIGGIAGAMKE